MWYATLNASSSLKRNSRVPTMKFIPMENFTYLGSIPLPAEPQLVRLKRSSCVILALWPLYAWERCGLDPSWYLCFRTCLDILRRGEAVAQWGAAKPCVWVHRRSRPWLQQSTSFRPPYPSAWGWLLWARVVAIAFPFPVQPRDQLGSSWAYSIVPPSRSHCDHNCAYWWIRPVAYIVGLWMIMTQIIKNQYYHNKK